ncbi:MAG: repressor LexA [Elusimicrobia bacterium]|nr:repressor LexA [Elusimicrobiota bacterium]
MENLTKKQKEIYDFILVRAAQGEPHPTFREIGRHFGLAVGTVQDHISALKAKGALKRQAARMARAISVTEGASGVEIPILGRVGAGPGMIAQDHVEGHFNFRSFTLGTDFLLRVKGDSMVEAGIMEGDLVQVRRQPTAEDGDIVVALVGEEGVVKRLRRSGRAYHLESANPHYAPITTSFQVIGKVLGLVRRYDGRPRFRA